MMALTCMVAEILYEVERKKVSFQRFEDYLYDDDFVSKGWYVPNVELAGSVHSELDPFGCFMQDGVPVVWVAVVAPVEKIHARLEHASGFGTHVYLDDGEWQWKTIPIADGKQAIDHWMDRGLNVNVNLSVRLEILGRMRSSLKSDLERVIKEARTFLAVAPKRS